MKITILNKFEVKIYTPETSAALIRISSQELKKIDESKYIDIACFYFNDVKEATEYSIKDKEARELIDFIIKNKDVNEFVVHCDYAQGRSPAIAIFIAEVFNIQNNFKQSYPNYNKYVLEKLQNHF